MGCFQCMPSEGSGAVVFRAGICGAAVGAISVIETISTENPDTLTL